MTDKEDPYVAPLSSDAVIRQTRRLIEYLSETQRELEQYVSDLEAQEQREHDDGDVRHE